jgi:hypothetical protein
MNKLRLLSYLLLAGATGFIACTKNTLNLPQPAQTIEGVYKAQTTSTLFPIQGKTLQLIVKQVSADSVSVVVQAIVNEQAGDSLTYRSVFVNQEFSMDGCVAYRVYLTDQKVLDPQDQKGFEQLTMTCDEKNVFKYFYKPAGQQVFTVLKFKKL